MCSLTLIFLFLFQGPNPNHADGTGELTQPNQLTTAANNLITVEDGNCEVSHDPQLCADALVSNDGNFDDDHSENNVDSSDFTVIDSVGED